MKAEFMKVVVICGQSPDFPLLNSSVTPSHEKCTCVCKQLTKNKKTNKKLVTIVFSDINFTIKNTHSFFKIAKNSTNFNEEISSS